MRRSSLRRSVTLLEMVIVLLILFSLTAIGTSLYPNLALRANLTGTIETIKETANNLAMFETLTAGGMPDNMDTMRDRVMRESTVDAGDAIPVLPTPHLVATDLTAVSAVLGVLPADLLDAFAIKGVDSVHAAPPAPIINQSFDKFEPVDVVGAPPVAPLGRGVALAAGTEVFTLSREVMIDKFNIDPGPVGVPPNSVYIAFGLGSVASNVGTPTGLMVNPVYTPDVSRRAELLSGASPAAPAAPGGPIFPFMQTSSHDFYSRYIGVWKITPVTGGGAAGGKSIIDISFAFVTYPHPVCGLGNMDYLLGRLDALNEVR